jgi:hypothetical protein
MATATQDFSSHPPGKKSIEGNDQYVENLNPMPTQGTYYNSDSTTYLSPEHRQYMLDHHGTFDLDPMPDMGDADPYNWPNWKVC